MIDEYGTLNEDYPDKRFDPILKEYIRQTKQNIYEQKKRNYRISDKTKALRKIFDAKINLLNTIEEAKIIFNALNIQHTFDKLYEVLNETQDTSEEESECHQDEHDTKDT
ncbi:11308_t:CDS:2 [Ambispora leptoticha]|uniref:11308_t:CDS:1 n=1 Tax=Ambispora leptoticha TaxID=144679 RepID=A0A9N9GST3_9GLOM|nr:11308_t:CDS:2 [Ambispora leptoticha]